MRTSILLAVVLAVGCGGDDPAGGGCGSTSGGAGGSYKRVLACDSTALGIHMCTEYYTNVSSAGASVDALCSAFMGKKLSGGCGTDGSVGSCTDSSTTTGGQYGIVSVNFEYDSDTTTDKYQTECTGNAGTFNAPGDAVGGLPGSSSASTTTTCRDSKGSSGSGVAFSISTELNGMTIECTNYVGSVSGQELSSVEMTGAVPKACPTDKATCTCAGGMGVFGTKTTMVHYDSVVTSSSSNTDCEDLKSSCSGTYSDTYKP
jgi:hypothetical protein